MSQHAKRCTDYAIVDVVAQFSTPGANNDAMIFDIDCSTLQYLCVDSRAAEPYLETVRQTLTYTFTG